MSPRTGTGIRKRSNGWGYEIMIGGQRYTGTCPTTNKREAIKWIDDLRRKLRAANSVEEAVDMRIQMATGDNDIMLRLLWLEFESRLPKGSLKPATVTRTSQCVQDFVAWMASEHPQADRISRVTHQHAQEYISRLERGGPFLVERGLPLSPATRNIFLTQLRRVFRDVTPRESRHLNPWLHIPVQRSSPHSVRTFTDQEIITLTTQTSGHMRFMFTVGIYTGLRMGDVATLRGESVDLESRWIEVQTRKTRSVAAIPILQPLFEFLREWGVKPGYLCPYAADTYLRSRQAMSSQIGRLFDRLGIRANSPSEYRRSQIDVSFHSCRHTFITMAARARVPLPVIQGAVGHMTQEMTMRYASHFNREQVHQMFLPAEQLIPGAYNPNARARVKSILDGVPDDRMEELLGILEQFNSGQR